MGDADIIPIGTKGAAGRGAGKRPSSAARSLAGKSGGKPGEKSATAKPAAQKPSAEKPAVDKGQPAAPAKKAVAAKPPVRKTAATDPKAAKVAPVTALPAAEGPAADVPEAPEPPAYGAPLTAVPPLVEDAVAKAPAEPEKPLGIPVSDIIAAVSSAAKEVFGPGYERRLAEMLAFLRRRVTGDYTVDEYGFDRELSERFLVTAARPLAEKWFRIEVRGAENIPATGGALVVSNHSGTVPVDAAMTMFQVLEHSGRPLRALGADLVFKMPFVSEVARRSGATLACQEDAERMLRGGELVGVWPEGFKGIGKPYSERYKLQRFGRGGFVSAALRTGVPIIPVSVVGAEEIYPLVGNIPSLARLLGVPYIPITPFFPLLGPLGMIPLPSKWIIEFGEPIRTDEYDAMAADDPMLVFDVTDQVRETIQTTLYRLLMDRTSVFA